MVDIDFSLSIPSSYFVAVNMLIEFLPNGIVIPTRIDILPYKLSPFTKFKEDNTSTIDLLKFMLVLYTAYIVFQNFYGYYKRKTLLQFSNIVENGGDLMIIFLQTFCFAIKMQDSNSFDINPMEILGIDNRMKQFGIYFYAVNFRDFQIMETIGLIFIMLKLVDGARVVSSVNVIVLALN
jgi:hypothetical protein